MNFVMILYGIAVLLIIVIVAHVIINKKVSLGDTIALLGIVISVILTIIFSPDTTVKITDTSSIAGNWVGTIVGDTDDFSAEIEINIQPNCSINNICGTYYVQAIACSGNLTLIDIKDKIFYFREQRISENCGGGLEQITLLPNGTLAWVFEGFNSLTNQETKSHATLIKK